MRKYAKVQEIHILGLFIMCHIIVVCDDLCQKII